MTPTALITPALLWLLIMILLIILFPQHIYPVRALTVSIEDSKMMLRSNMIYVINTTIVNSQRLLELKINLSFGLMFNATQIPWF